MREDPRPKVTDEVVEVKSHFRFAEKEQPGVIELINNTYEFLQESRQTGGAVTLRKIIVHLARQLEVERRKTRKLGALARERRSTIDGMTEYEADVGMVRAASIISPGCATIHNICIAQGFTPEQSADLYENRERILALLLSGLRRDGLSERMLAACNSVLAECVEKRQAEAEAQESVDDILEFGYLPTDEEKAANVSRETKDDNDEPEVV